MNETNALLHTDVTLTGRRGRYTAEKGSVLQILGTAGDNTLTVGLGRMSAQISMDDASPVIWDADEQMWTKE